MRLLTVEETAKKIGFVAFGPGTEYGTPAIQGAAEDAIRVVLRDVRLCHEQEDVPTERGRLVGWDVERVGRVTVDAHDVVASLEPNTGPDCQIEGRMVAVLKPVSREEDHVKRATLVVKFQFSSAHHLPHHDGECGNLHGHTWRGELVVSAPVDETTGMSIDFSELKEVVDTNLPDHLNLNDSLPSPTCENVAELLVLSLQGALPRGLIVKEITLWESDRCGVRVTVHPDPGPVLVNR